VTAGEPRPPASHAKARWVWLEAGLGYAALAVAAFPHRHHPARGYSLAAWAIGLVMAERLLRQPRRGWRRVGLYLAILLGLLFVYWGIYFLWGMDDFVRNFRLRLQ
jgi:hypothetical protein